jgi:hypothetical protein
VAEPRALRAQLGTAWADPLFAQLDCARVPRSDADQEWDDYLLGDDYSNTDYGSRDFLLAHSDDGDATALQNPRRVTLAPIIQLEERLKKS